MGHLQAGCSVTQVAELFHLSRRGVYDLIHKYREFHSVIDLPRTGRPRVTTDDTDREIVLRHEQNPFSTAVATSVDLGDCSRETVRRRLREAGLRARRPAVHPLLTELHRHNRMNWARQHLRWNAEQWSEVLFTDESKFELDACDRRLRCYRRRGERFDEAKIIQIQNRGYGSVTVWGGILGGIKTPLVRVNGRLNAERYIDLLRNHTLPFINNNNVAYLMQDNAPAHRALATQQFLEDQDIQTIDWPSVSPDMNPIEHVWSYMKRELKKHGLAEDPDDLFETLIRIWNELDENFIRSLTQSMRKRVRCLHEAEGGHTKY